MKENLLPLVSIIMPCYNAEKYLIESISSVIEQSLTSWELLVVDDKSTDSSRDIILGFNDERIKLLELDNNTGSPSGPRNVGLKHARGQFVAFLDSDDLWLKDKLKEQIDFMMSNDISFSCTGYFLFGDREAKYIPPHVVDYSSLLSNNSIGCLTAVIRKSVIQSMSFPNVGHEDYALWLQILRAGYTCHALQKPLARYRVVQGSVSSNKLSVVPFFWNIYRTQEGYSVYKSFYFCLKYLINVVFLKYKKIG
ncbi:TPA: glycosyltransferase [Vibrio vulnificus]|uniref:glycosyltransferase family 2 protein n=1 Tax=Vibrio vulnificus TaxID=672 RepID=UPI00031F54AD|nr:glycosyltransferase family 2 protein [Vibrio vulnificus]HAS6938352.1 glycosyltransferase [Vibrio vulnificus]